MRGGTITGNVTDGYGGGIANAAAIFRISDGIITGIDYNSGGNSADLAGVALINTSSGGIPHISQHGIFNGNEFNSLGTLGSSDNTLKVVNGELVDFSGDTANPVHTDLTIPELELPELRLMLPEKMLKLERKGYDLLE